MIGKKKNRKASTWWQLVRISRWHTSHCAQGEYAFLFTSVQKTGLDIYTDINLASQTEPGICLTTIYLQSQMHLESVVALCALEGNAPSGQFAPKWKLKPFISRGLCGYRLRWQFFFFWATSRFFGVPFFPDWQDSTQWMFMFSQELWRKITFG